MKNKFPGAGKIKTCEKCIFFKKSDDNNGICTFDGQYKDKKICIKYNVDDYDYF